MIRSGGKSLPDNAMTGDVNELNAFFMLADKTFYDVTLRAELHYNSYGKVASDDLIASALALSPVKRTLVESLSSHARAEIET